MLDYGREICGVLPSAERREWLVTNGIGGYAMGTIAGTLTRRYHGLLVAALKPPLGRTLMLAKLDETVTYQGQEHKIHNNRWASGEVEPNGHHYLESFHLEGTTPVWCYALADALLEKRIWMQPGTNTTYIRYTMARGLAPVKMYAKAFVNYRDYHATTIAADWATQIETLHESGMKITAFPGAAPLYLLCDAGKAWPETDWYWYEDFFLSVEEYRGFNDVTEDHLYPGTFEIELKPGDSATIIASTEPTPNPDGGAALIARQTYEAHLPRRAPALDAPRLRHLALAADQFIVRRATPADAEGRSIIAGYPWFSDWGRDTMIALPGLTLTTGRAADAAKILRTFARFVDRGMLPNRFPDAGETPEYNTVDATLWYFEAIRAYFAATNDLELVRELQPVLADIIAWHQRGTRYQIHVDEEDGLLFAGEKGVQLTWMDAKVDDWVVTPRIGKPVEVNALWYNALRVMGYLCRSLEMDTAPYDTLADRARAGFARFWNDRRGCCYDVLDGPAGHDDALRPNQLFAVSLPYTPLPPARQKAVVDVCAAHLLTSHGLRSLAPDDEAYVGHYGGDPYARDGAYHQGTVWSWLIGPFVSAHLRVYGNPRQALAYLRPLLHQLDDHGVGSVSEIFDGDPPFTPRGCPAQAWGVAELLRAWRQCQQAQSEEQYEQQ